MKGLRRGVVRYDRASLYLIEEACGAVDLLRQSFEPALLKSLQDWLRGVTSVTEDDLARIRKRRDRRRKLFSPDLVRANKLSMGPHMELVQIREALLERRRDALRQIGDATVWLALRGDKRILGLLYEGSRTQQLPQEDALIGQLSIIEQLSELPGTFVLDNDLCRVLGFGDVTLVRPPPAPLRPLPIEIRTRGPILADPASARIELHTVITDVPFDQELLKAIASAVELQEGPEPAEGTRKHRQVSEIMDRTEKLFRVYQDRRPGLPPPRPLHRDRIALLATKADLDGHAFDSPEEGLVYAAVRVREAQSLDAAVQPMLARLERFGYAPNDPRWSFVKSDDVTRIGKYSVIAPPIPLWDFEPLVRALVMNSDLIIFCFFSPDVWRQAFAGAGLVLAEQNDMWEVDVGEESINFSPIEVLHVKVGAAFLGFSPRQIAEVVAERAA